MLQEILASIGYSNQLTEMKTEI